LVTLPGEAFVSRVAGSILTTAGLSDLIARDGDDYVKIALELARNPAHLAAVKQRVRDAKQSPLFDSARYTRNLEALYRAMWRRKAKGLPTASIDATGQPVEQVRAA
jgi:predicted O-linked N-acetylglucosamine transferase (SPINDLY family)